MIYFLYLFIDCIIMDFYFSLGEFKDDLVIIVVSFVLFDILFVCLFVSLFWVLFVVYDIGYLFILYYIILVLNNCLIIKIE